MQTIIDQIAATIREAARHKTPLCIRGGGSKDFYGGALRGEMLAVDTYRGIVDYEPSELVITARAGTPLAEIETALRERGQMLAFEPPHFDQLSFAPSPLAPLPEGEGRPGTTSFSEPCPEGEGRPGAPSSTISNGEPAVLPSPPGRGTEGEGRLVEKRSATLGGCIAAGVSGPRRAYAGAVRDFVLGVRMLDGKGRDLRFGGQVMKNVAGFDVSRLIAGSLGTLGVILEVSLKVLPLPVAETTLHFEKNADESIALINAWAGQPLPISATVWHGGDLRVRLSGAGAAVEAAVKQLGGEHIAAAQSEHFWQGIREHTHPFFNTSLPLWRLSLKSTTPTFNAAGAQMIEWGGALRWLASDADAHAVRAIAAAGGGHATMFRGGDKSTGVFHPLPPALMSIHRNLKHAFDPAGIFNPGRFYDWK